ncbi:MAG: hypothetical protein V8Q76_05540 [Bacteroides intestinalis]
MRKSEEDGKWVVSVVGGVLQSFPYPLRLCAKKVMNFRKVSQQVILQGD